MKTLLSLDNTKLRLDDNEHGSSYADGFCDDYRGNYERCTYKARYIIEGFALCGMHANCMLNRHHAPRIAA